MKIHYIVIYLSMLFWIFPAVKQFKTDLFWYFLVFAIGDPITSLFWFLLKAQDPYENIFFSFLLLLSVTWLFKKQKSIILLIAVILSLTLFSLYRDNIFMANLIILVHALIIYFFLKRTFIFIASYGKVNIFHLLLLLEEISIIFKIVSELTSFKPSLVYFYATSAFEILIAIFFTLYREDNPKLHIDLRNV